MCARHLRILLRLGGHLLLLHHHLLLNGIALARLRLLDAARILVILLRLHLLLHGVFGRANLRLLILLLLRFNHCSLQLHFFN